MHGLIVNQLRSYTLARYGRPAWANAVRDAGVSMPAGPPPFDTPYPDAVVVSLVVAMAQRAGREVAEVVEEFGAFLAPALLRVYEPLIRPQWRTLDVVENVEEHVHTAVRMRDSTAGPPYLRARRRSATEVEVIYTSPRRLCALAEGIVRGLGEHFAEPIAISQPECMLRGDAQCVILVERPRE